MIEDFTKYVSNYDLSDANIKRKYDHSIRVMNLAEKYAKKLRFNKEDIEIAKIIGLLHDIGRFEQYKRYKTYDDLKSIDHADYGVHELFDNNLINKFNINKDYYDIIHYSIKNHNKLIVNKTNNKVFIKHSNLIRDIDKIDLLYTFSTIKKFKIDNSIISDKVIEDIMNHKQVDRKHVKTNNERIVVKFGFVFDINNNICLKELKSNLKKYYLSLNDKNNIFKNIYDETIKYIDEKLLTNIKGK
ncbi:MAG: HD domain-containing protein [Bacilli bacterium]|nr:HD domain-containing protein [Bacilli bacterium]